MTKYSLLPGIMESVAFHLVLEMEGVRIVGQGLLKTNQHAFIKLETVVGVYDWNAPIEFFIEGYERAERTEVVLDEMHDILLETGIFVPKEGVGDAFFAGVFKFRHVSIG